MESMKRRIEKDVPGPSRALDDEEEEQFESKKLKMNSLDSDEEDEHAVEKEKYNVAGAENTMFDGQEKATIDFDGEIQISAFNMEEEMQEGHFDKSGTFIFKKDKEMIKDSWLDNIDWVKVKEKESGEGNKGLADSSDSEDEFNKDVNVKDVFSKMLDLMQPGENVLRCIKRLGGGGGAKNKRDKKKLEPEKQELLDRMIGFANSVLSTGDMDIYQRTYEQLKLALAPKQDADMDMFADEDGGSKATASTSNGKSGDEVLNDKITWEYKWEDKSDAKIYGPYSSEDMLAWTQEGYFGDGVFVRKRHESNFYSSKRIDFDLYI